jgi:hypothetical protein
MMRSVLFTLVLLMISALAFGQAVVTPSGVATSNGIAIPVAPVSPPLLVTPIVHLSNAPTEPSPSGISALAAPQSPTAPSSRAEIEYGQPTAIYLTQPSPVEPASVAPSSAPAATPPQVDLGVNSSAAIAVSDGQNGRSLGEIARQMRQNMQNANAKLYTNSDVEQLPTAGGITGTTASVPPQQFPPNGEYPVGNNGVIEQNGQPMGQAIATPGNSAANNGGTATEQPLPAQPPANQQPMNQAPTSAPPNNTQPEQQPAPQKPSAGTIPPPQTSQAEVPANPADQNAAAAPSNAPANQPTHGSLPKSASLLPLIALVGAGATIAGLMARKS